jgi:Mycoplasma protein of unknown function, DUF285
MNDGRPMNFPADVPTLLSLSTVKLANGRSGICYSWYGTCRARTMRNDDNVAVDGALDVDPTAPVCAYSAETNVKTYSKRPLAPFSDEGASGRHLVVHEPPIEKDPVQCRDNVEAVATKQDGPIHGPLRVALGCTLLEAKAAIAAARPSNGNPASCRSDSMPGAQYVWSDQLATLASSRKQATIAENRGAPKDSSSDMRSADVALIIKATVGAESCSVEPILQVKAVIAAARAETSRLADLAQNRERLDRANCAHNIDHHQLPSLNPHHADENSSASRQQSDVMIASAILFEDWQATDEEQARARVVREARATFLAETALAVPIGNVAEFNNSQGTRNRCSWRRTTMAIVLCVIVCTVIAAVLAWPAGESSSAPSMPIRASTVSPAPSTAPLVYTATGHLAFTQTHELYAAVDKYQQAQQQGTDLSSSLVAKQYGYPMATWDVSRIRDFSRVFDPARTEKLDASRNPSTQRPFDEDLSEWDTSNATTMAGMFAGATHFTGKGLERWNVAKVTDFSYMFAGVLEFAGNLSSWNTSRALTMAGMFLKARRFNGDLSRIDVANVASMSFMFDHAESFVGGNLHNWNVTTVTDMASMFARAKQFRGGISTWDGVRVASTKNMVRFDATLLLFNFSLLFCLTHRAYC